MMVDNTAINKLLDNRKKNPSVDRRVSERMFYDRTKQ